MDDSVTVGRNNACYVIVGYRIDIISSGNLNIYHSSQTWVNQLTLFIVRCVFGRAHFRDDIFLPNSVLLRDVLDQGFPRLELDFANAALHTPPLRVHLHVILELVLVAQDFVANLDGRKSRLIIDRVNNCLPLEINLHLRCTGKRLSPCRCA